MWTDFIMIILNTTTKVFQPEMRRQRNTVGEGDRKLCPTNQMKELKLKILIYIYTACYKLINFCKPKFSKITNSTASSSITIKYIT